MQKFGFGLMRLPTVGGQYTTFRQKKRFMPQAGWNFYRGGLL